MWSVLVDCPGASVSVFVERGRVVVLDVVTNVDFAPVNGSGAGSTLFMQEFGRSGITPKLSVFFKRSCAISASSRGEFHLKGRDG